MNRYLKKVSTLLRSLTRTAKKGVRGATRHIKKVFHRGGNPNAVAAPAAAAAANAPVAPAAPANAPVAKPPRKSRKPKGPLRRVTNAVRRVGKGFRNALTRVFSKKSKHRRKKVLQRGSSENMSKSSGANSPGIPPAPPV